MQVMSFELWSDHFEVRWVRYGPYDPVRSPEQENQFRATDDLGSKYDWSGGGHNWTEAVRVGNWRFSPALNSAARALEITLLASDNRENAELLWKIDFKPEKQ